MQYKWIIIFPISFPDMIPDVQSNFPLMYPKMK